MVLLHGGSLTGHPTAIRASQREVATLRPVNVADNLVSSFVSTDVVTFDTLFGEVVTDILLVNLVVAIQGTVDVSVFTISSVGVQVSIQMFQ